MFILLLRLVELIVAIDHDSDMNVVFWHILVWMSDKAKYSVFAVVIANVWHNYWNDIYYKMDYFQEKN